jgi:hypothetical protein
MSISAIGSSSIAATHAAAIQRPPSPPRQDSDGDHDGSTAATGAAAGSGKGQVVDITA